MSKIQRRRGKDSVRGEGKMIRKEGEDRSSKRTAYPAARCSLSSICLASTGLKKCLHLTLSPYSLSHHNIWGRGGGDGGRAGWRGWRARKGKERKMTARRTEEEGVGMVGETNAHSYWNPKNLLYIFTVQLS